jgi:hypothetical protein
MNIDLISQVGSASLEAFLNRSTNLLKVGCITDDKFSVFLINLDKNLA